MLRDEHLGTTDFNTWCEDGKHVKILPLNHSPFDKTIQSSNLTVCDIIIHYYRLKRHKTSQEDAERWEGMTGVHWQIKSLAEGD